MIAAEVGDFATWVGGGSAATVLATLALRAMYRRWSRDGVELAKDRAEINIIQSLEQRNTSLQTAMDRAYEARDKAHAERDEANKNATQALRDVEDLRDKVQELTSEVKYLQRVIISQQQQTQWNGNERRNIE